MSQATFPVSPGKVGKYWELGDASGGDLYYIEGYEDSKKKVIHP